MDAECWPIRTSGKVISAQPDLAGVVRCIELGAEDYLPKSANLPLLRARLCSVLEKKRLRDLAAQRLAALEPELESARSAQLPLVPTNCVAIGGGDISVHGLMIPARQVGGDLYDAIRLDATRLLFGVADVSGKGAPAALTMARTLDVMRSAARRLAAASTTLPDPAEILTLANEELATANENSTFVTAVLGTLDVTAGEGLLAIAGHDAPVLLAAWSTPRLILPAARLPALGMLDGVRYRSDPLALLPGQTLFRYTDGVTEAEGTARLFYTRERLMARLSTPGGSPPPQNVVAAVIADLDSFSAGAPQSDDITMLAIRRD
jgi:sigma-B regulation protein RsbU (phosphoserine phosphatase)